VVDLDQEEQLMAGTQVLRLNASQADWLARAAAQYALQDGGEGYGFSTMKFEVFEVDKAAAIVGDAALMIRELRQSRSTKFLTCAKDIAARSSDNVIEYLGQRHMDIVRDEDGVAGRHEAERERDADAAEALLGLQILDAIKAVEKQGADSDEAERVEEAPPTPMQQITLAEIVIKRHAISRMWDHYELVEKAEDEEGKAKKARLFLFEGAQQADMELNELVLRKIAEGTVPARAAAQAALGSRELPVDAVDVARQEGAEV
jgi:hypothetical protein